MIRTTSTIQTTSYHIQCLVALALDHHMSVKAPTVVVVTPFCLKFQRTPQCFLLGNGGRVACAVCGCRSGCTPLQLLVHVLDRWGIQRANAMLTAHLILQLEESDHSNKSDIQHGGYRFCHGWFVHREISVLEFLLRWVLPLIRYIIAFEFDSCSSIYFRNGCRDALDHQTSNTWACFFISESFNIMDVNYELR